MKLISISWHGGNNAGRERNDDALFLYLLAGSMCVYNVYRRNIYLRTTSFSPRALLVIWSIAAALFKQRQGYWIWPVILVSVIVICLYVHIYIYMYVTKIHLFMDVCLHIPGKQASKERRKEEDTYGDDAPVAHNLTPSRTRMRTEIPTRMGRFHASVCERVRCIHTKGP